MLTHAQPKHPEIPYIQQNNRNTKFYNGLKQSTEILSPISVDFIKILLLKEFSYLFTRKLIVLIARKKV